MMTVPGGRWPGRVAGTRRLVLAPAFRECGEGAVIAAFRQQSARFRDSQRTVFDPDGPLLPKWQRR